jgi:hypothetical protein
MGQTRKLRGGVTLSQMNKATLRRRARIRSGKLKPSLLSYSSKGTRYALQRPRAKISAKGIIEYVDAEQLRNEDRKIRKYERELRRAKKLLEEEASSNYEPYVKEN